MLILKLTHKKILYYINTHYKIDLLKGKGGVKIYKLYEILTDVINLCKLQM